MAALRSLSQDLDRIVLGAVYTYSKRQSLRANNLNREDRQKAGGETEAQGSDVPCPWSHISAVVELGIE